MNRSVYIEKYSVLWYVFPRRYQYSGGYTNVMDVAGPYCVKKKCLGELEKQRVILPSGRIFSCPLCGETYTIKYPEKARDRVLNEYYAALRRSSRIEVINTERIQKYKKEIEKDDKWLQINAEAEGKDLKNVHILIGDRSDSSEKAHIIISGETGEIRVDGKHAEPERFLKAVEAVVDVKGKQRKSSIDFSEKKKSK